MALSGEAIFVIRPSGQHIKSRTTDELSEKAMSASPLDGDNLDLEYRLSDNLTRRSGRVFLNGTQALVRLLISQREFDRSRGLNTAGYVTGYRGSPLAGVDFELWRSRELVASHDVRFVPGVNEDLAATAVIGTQRVESEAARKVDGVFGMWYGKGPGVDRAGDALRHGNAAGASARGGVLLIVGDDHAATSSSIPNASDYSLMGWGIPIVHPSSVEEYEEFGLWGWELSRRSGAWVAFKAISETVESGRSVEIRPWPVFADVAGDEIDADQTHFRTSDFLTGAVEERLARKLEAVSAFSRRNSIDRLVVPAPAASIGIVAVGKAHHDVMEVLERIGAAQGNVDFHADIRIYRPGLTYPLDRERLMSFAAGLTHILVVEEKVSVVEQQVKEMLFNLPDNRRPSVSGRHDVSGAPLIPWVGQLRPAVLARPIVNWIEMGLGRRLNVDTALFTRPALLSNAADASRRLPYFCSGCPHNSSTRVPEGSRALAGVGCHYMASWMDRQTEGLTQMGGEGIDWLGTAPFVGDTHVFQNMGEGTYFHSGYLAIRQSIAAGVNITYKILFNDAVAMTGGQPVDGAISVPQIVQQMLSEGARRVVIVTDYPENYAEIKLGGDVPVHHRRELDAVQRALREIAGTTILIYDQTCAAEKRRRRKRGTYPDPQHRLMINHEVCEGCGDCGIQSNCLSITPRETAFGRKRQIDQSSCNKDYSCVEGFCPSFISIRGGTLRKTDKTFSLDDQMLSALPAPVLPDLEQPWNILVAGVGGTGVITVGALISMAAHLEGKAVSLLDFTALAQKGGSVLSHVRIARRGTVLHPVRIEWRQADLMLACDGVVSVLPDAIGTIARDRTRVVLNRHAAPLAEFTRNSEAVVPMTEIVEKLQAAAGEGRVEIIDAHEASTAVLGDSIGSNVFLLGYCWQRGEIPVSLDALMRAIELNGVAVTQNRLAFNAGRLAVENPAALKHSGAAARQPITLNLPERLEVVIERCRLQLARYQSNRYADTYVKYVEHVLQRERKIFPDRRSAPVSVAVATNLHRLMSYKDEYEVARLLCSASFEAEVDGTFADAKRISYHLAPPLLARRHPSSGLPQKMEFGSWLKPLLQLLARGKVLRGTPFDIFGRTAERRQERDLIDEYKSIVDDALNHLTSDNLPAVLAVVQSAAVIRGFGHVKQRNIDAFRVKVNQLRAALHQEAVPVRAA